MPRPANSPPTNTVRPRVCPTIAVYVRRARPRRRSVRRERLGRALRRQPGAQGAPARRHVVGAHRLRHRPDDGRGPRPRRPRRGHGGLKARVPRRVSHPVHGPAITPVVLRVKMRATPGRPTGATGSVGRRRKEEILMSRITHRRRWALGVALAVVVQLALIGPSTSAGATTDDPGPDLEGTRRVLRFTVMVANIGDADIVVGDPNEHIEEGSNLFEFAECHGHYHFRNYALYELIDPATGTVWRAAKAGFCMIDTDPNPAWMGTPPGEPYYLSCGGVGRPGNQGISAGWTDTYRKDLQGQFFVLDGGDGQEPVPAGSYLLRITANPPYEPTADNPCRHEDPATGLCHALPESDYTDNDYAVEITVPD